MKNLLNISLCILFLLQGKNINAQAKETETDFIRRIEFSSLPLSMEGSDSNHKKLEFLNKEQRAFLQIPKQFGKPELLKDRFWIVAKVEISTNFNSLIIEFYKADGNVESQLINYDKNWDLIASQKLSSFIKEADKNSFDIDKQMLTVIDKKGAYSHFKRFLISSKGEFIPMVYPTLESLRNNGYFAETRAVKAFNGLVYRDSAGQRLGKFNYGDAVFIQSYSRDSIEITEKGKKIKTRKAKVILDMDAYYKHTALAEIAYPFAFVAEHYLFKNWFDDSKYGEEYYEIHPEDILDRELYDNDFTSSGDNYSEAQINLLEVFDIRKVELENYEKQIISRQSFNPKFYQNPNNSFLLEFKNGNKRELRDSVYSNMEYSPTQHFEKIEFPSQPNTLLIFESFFEDSWFTLFNLDNGDTISQFDGYPFYSPNSKWIVNVNTPLSFSDETTALQLKCINQGKYMTCVRVNFLDWNLPEVLEVLWISDKEFLVKVVRVRNSYGDHEERVPYYLKFKILLEP